MLAAPHRFWPLFNASALLLALPLRGAAQPQPVPAPKVYVGLGVSLGTYGAAFDTAFPTLTAGVQLNSRWALQASAGYRQRTYAYAGAGQFLDPNGQAFPGVYHSDDRIQLLALPVLARYALTRRAAHRFQADAVGGFTLVRLRTSGHFQSFNGSNPVPVYDYRYDVTHTGAFASFGPGVRYRLGGRLEATGDVVFNYLLNKASYGQLVHRFTTANAAVSVRYHFGKS